MIKDILPNEILENIQSLLKDPSIFKNFHDQVWYILLFKENIQINFGLMIGNVFDMIEAINTKNNAFMLKKNEFLLMLTGFKAQLLKFHIYSDCKAYFGNNASQFMYKGKVCKQSMSFKGQETHILTFSKNVINGYIILVGIYANTTDINEWIKNRQIKGIFMIYNQYSVLHVQ